MSHIITEKCLGERYGTCMAVCPVSCIHPGEHQGRLFMVIDPDTCIDCGICLPECPIGAIIDNVDDDPAATKLNTELTPAFINNDHDIEVRPMDDPPKKPGNTLVN